MAAVVVRLACVRGCSLSWASHQPRHFHVGGFRPFFRTTKLTFTSYERSHTTIHFNTLHIHLNKGFVKNESPKASFAVALLLGSIVNNRLNNLPNPVGRSCSKTNCSIGFIFLTCSILLEDSTPLILCQPRESKHFRAREEVDRSSTLLRKGPTARSINAKCSAFWCVAKSSPPEYSSAMMQPALHRSDGKDHVSKPRRTSGARYCRVLTMVDFFSLS